MTAKLLTSPPVSGEFDEVAFGRSGNFTWVLFDEATARPLVGSFPDGDGGKTSAFSVSEREHFLVADGRGYFVSNDGKLLFAFDDYDLRDAVPVNREGWVVAHDNFDLLVLSSAGVLWESGRVAWDGIAIDGVAADRVTGRLEPLDEPREFRLLFPHFKFVAERAYPD